MKRYFLILLCLIPFLSHGQATVPFSCEAFGYLFQNNPTDVVRVDLQTGTATEVASNLFGEDVSAGYNRVDNYIWLIGKKTGDLIKVDKNWNFTRYTGTNLPKSLNVADVDANGIFYMYAGGIIYRYDLNTNPPTQLSSLTTTSTGISDFAVSPIDGFIYGVENAGNVYRFNPANGVRTYMGKVASLDNQAYGAVYFDGSGNLYLNGNTNGKIFQISHNSLTSGSPSASAVFFSQASKASTNDGARCASAPLCKVGNIAPILSIASLTNSCNSTSINLASITSSNTPNGTILTWHSGNPTTNINKLSNLTTSAPGTSTYYATFYDATNDCYSASNTPFTVTINSIPSTPTGAAVNKTGICIGQSVSLSASCSLGTIRWYSNGTLIGTGSPFSHSPTVSTNYTSTCNTTSPTCESNSTSPLSVTVNSIPTAPTISAGNTRICSGNSTTITATGCTGTVTWSNSKTGNSIIESPTTTTSYNATCTSSSNCVSGNSTSVQITVISSTGTTISIDNSTICAGQTANLKMDNCTGTINWFITGSTTVIGTTATLPVSPSSNTTYNGTCNGTAALNCSSTSSSNNIPVVVNSLPAAPTVSVTGASTICSGGSTTLTASGCAGGTITWSNSSTGANITVSPTVGTTSYNALCTLNGCSSLASNSVSVIVKAIPNTPAAVVDVAICSGQSTSLSGNCSTPSVLTWYSNAALTTLVSLPVSPSTTTSYRAVCKDGTCLSAVVIAQVVVTATPSTPSSVSALPATICSGQESKLSATCASPSNLTWYSDVTLSTIVPSDVVSPTSTKTYYAACVNGVCKSLPQSVLVTVNVSPASPTSLSVSSNICSGVTSNLVGTCQSGSTIKWYNAVVDVSTLVGSGSPFSVSPSETTTYIATCKDNSNSCESTSSAGIQYTLVTTPSKPTNLIASPSAICSGQSSNLSASCSTGTLTWFSDMSLSTAVTSPVSPNSTTTYYAVCVLNGCLSSSSTVTVQVTTTPAIPNPVSASKNAICKGESVTLNATCVSSTAIWYSDVNLTAIINNIESPSTTTTYYVACVNGACSSASKSEEITVTPTPNTPTAVSSNQSSICAGGSAVLSATCSGGTTLAWYSDESLTSSLSSTTISPLVTTTYYAVCENGSCKGSSVLFTQRVSPNPDAPTITPASRNLCLGFSVTLTASGCTGNLLWSNGATTTTIEETPLLTTDYTVTCTNTTTNCVSDASGITKITVVTPPTSPSITSNKSSICLGESVLLSSNNCTGVVRWFISGSTTVIGTGTTITVNPTINTNYTATCTVSSVATDALECESGTAIPLAIVVNPIPNPLTISSPDLNICIGESTSLNSSACSGGTISWSNGLTGASISVNPIISTSYTAKCIVNGCESVISNELNLISTPIPSSPTGLAATSICEGQNSSLTGICNTGTIKWYSDIALSNVVNSPVSPTTSTVYYATCIQDNCESSSALTSVDVSPVPSSPTAVSASPVTLCANERTELYATCASGEIKWFEETSLTTELSSTILNPTTSVTYYASCVNGNCKSTPVSQAITVNELPSAPTLSASTLTVCQTSSTTLTATGCLSSVKWSNGEITNSIIVTPISTTQYTAICTDANSCSSASSNVLEITVVLPPDKPIVSASLNSICNGGTSILTVTTGCSGSISWFLDNATTSFSNSNPLTVDPTITSGYKAICESTSGITCPSPESNETRIEVKALPIITDIITPVCNDAANSILAFSTLNGGSSTVSVSNSLAAIYDNDGRFGDSRAVWVVENIPNNTTFSVTVNESGCESTKNYLSIDCNATASSAYPLDLLLFTAENQSEGILLNWVVANEIGVALFEIQKSDNAVDFSKLGTVKSINSTDYYTYSFVDANPFPQNNYYKLLSYDLDGTINYSKIISVRFTGNSKFEWNLFPNPLHLDERIIYISTNGIEDITSIRLLNIKGESLNFERMESNKNTIPLRIGSLAPGSYFIKIITDSSNFSKKFIKSN